MSDQIKLAKAMGWYQDGKWWRNKLIGCDSLHPPNPFVDANDDYAVLEWMRGRGLDDPLFQQFAEMVLRVTSFSYQIGDYARAALKVINGE